VYFADSQQRKDKSMEFKLTKEQELIQKTARDFADRSIEPAIDHIMKEHAIPQEILDGMKELDLFCLPISEAYGGAGAGYQSYVVALEQIASVSPGVAIVISVNCFGLAALEMFGSEELKQRYMPGACTGKNIMSIAMTEPEGADPRLIKTTAVRENDEYVLNGTKRFITACGYEGPIVIFARESDTGQICGFVVEKFCEGYSVSEPWEKMGLQGTPMYDVYLKDVRIPVGNMLGELNQGFRILKNSIALGKIGLSSIFLGTILAAYEECMKYAGERMYLGKPLTQFQYVQGDIVDIAMKYEAARWLAYRLGYLADMNEDKGNIIKDSALTKMFVTNTAVEVARSAINIHGSYGLMENYKVSRIWRDAIFGPQTEGTNALLKSVVAMDILKRSK
jgi:alkylation response protein AidB-like acyl-CoA dehydrogenase